MATLLQRLLQQHRPTSCSEVRTEQSCFQDDIGSAVEKPRDQPAIANPKRKTGVNEGERRADILITNVHAGGTVIDVVISQPNIAVHRTASTTPNLANDKARIEKINDYQKDIKFSSHATLVIAAFETGGRPDPKWTSWLQSYLKRKYPHKDECAIQLNRVKQIISVHLRKAVADQYLAFRKQHSETAIFDIVDRPPSGLAAAAPAGVPALRAGRRAGRPPGSRNRVKPVSAADSAASLAVGASVIAVADLS